jgi:hypothetical protein
MLKILIIQLLDELNTAVISVSEKVSLQYQTH